MQQIYGFYDSYRFLSNFWDAPVLFDGMLFHNNEAAFQAAKCLDLSDRVPFTVMSPAKAKRAGRRVTLRPDWEDVKLDIMKTIVLDKFTRHLDLKAKLLATGNAQLVEANTWHDRFWGVDQTTGTGQNHLGIILMEVRDELQNQ